MSSSPSDGGSAVAWEQCLLEPLNPDDTCPICYDVMVTPSYGCRNKHNACKECFQDYLNTDAEGSVRCPGGCGQRISTIQTNTAREATINRLPARCRHSNLGCKWEGSFGELISPHLESECPYEPVACPYASFGCTATLRRNELEAHLASNSLKHLELTGSRFTALSSTVASLQAAVETLQDQAAVTQHRLNGAPKLIELALSRPTAQVQPDGQMYLGMYQLDERALINERPLFVHCEDDRFCIAFNQDTSTWHAQLREEAGEARGFHAYRLGRYAETIPQTSLFPCDAKEWMT